MIIALAIILPGLVLFTFLKSGQRVVIVPQDPPGKAALALVVLAIVTFFPTVLLMRPDADSGTAVNPGLAVALTLIPLAAVATGLWSVIRSKERCILAFLAAALGLCLLLGTIGYFFI